MTEYAKMSDELMVNETSSFVNTDIIAASVNGRRDHVNLTEPVFYTLEHASVCLHPRPICPSIVLDMYSKQLFLETV